MEYYFKVIFNYDPQVAVLVKAKNVIEAGEKAVKAFVKGYWISPYEDLVEIIKTDICEVIE